MQYRDPVERQERVETIENHRTAHERCSKTKERSPGICATPLALALKHGFITNYSHSTAAEKEQKRRHGQRRHDLRRSPQPGYNEQRRHHESPESKADIAPHIKHTHPSRFPAPGYIVRDTRRLRMERRDPNAT